MPEGVWTGADLRKAPKEKQDARIIVTTLITSYLLSLAIGVCPKGFGRAQICGKPPKRSKTQE